MYIPGTSCSPVVYLLVQSSNRRCRRLPGYSGGVAGWRTTTRMTNHAQYGNVTRTWCDKRPNFSDENPPRRIFKKCTDHPLDTLPGVLYMKQQAAKPPNPCSIKQRVPRHKACHEVATATIPAWTTTCQGVFPNLSEVFTILFKPCARSDRSYGSSHRAAGSCGTFQTPTR